MKLIIILLFFPYFSSSYWFDCTPCNCLYNENDLKTGNCNKKFDIPDLEEIPKKIDKEIKVLEFKEQFLTILRQNHFGQFPNLQEIYLNKNKISVIQENAFKNLFNLSKLDLSYNKISILPFNIFSDTPNINYLWINNNFLSSLQKNLFSNLIFLNEIHLQENKIAQVAKECFFNVPSLSVIDISYNNLQNLQLNIIDDNKSLKYFILHGNPWICDKSFCEFRETALKNNWLTTTPDCTRNTLGKYWNDLTNYTVNIIANKTTIIEEENVEFYCEFNSCIRSELIWISNHKDLKQPETLRKDDKYISVLTLKNVDKSDEGNYICSVLDCYDCKTSQIYLNVTEKPKSTTRIIELTVETQVIQEIKISTTKLPETSSTNSSLAITLPILLLFPLIVICCCCCLCKRCFCYRIRQKFQRKSKNRDKTEEETVQLNQTNI